MSGFSARSQDSLREAVPIDVPVNRMTLVCWTLTGMGSWWCLFTIIAELPHFVENLPEKAALGNLLAVCTQIGNVFPLVFKACAGQGCARLGVVILLSQLLAVATLVVCAFLWDTQVGSHSIILLVCTVVAGGVGCLSNVTHWAMARYHPAGCTRAMTIGMTFSGIIASLFAASQLAGCDSGAPRFSPKVFFIIAALVQTLQLAAFFTHGFSHKDGSNGLGSIYSFGVTPPDSVIHSFAGSRVSAVGSRGIPSFGSQSAGNTGCERSDGISEPVTASGSERHPTPADFVLRTFAVKVTLSVCFSVYAVTYTVPTLQPFMVEGYRTATERQQLLLGVMVLQNIGDVLGRMATICLHGSKSALFIWGFILLMSFFTIIYLTAERVGMPDTLSYTGALWLFLAISGTFYFSRGLLVTALYLRMHTSIEKVDEVLSTHMAYAGQLGTFMANALTFLLVNFFSVFT